MEFDAQPNTTVTGCNGRECFSKTVTYYAEMNQIKALIGISSECHQSISVKSFNLFHNFKSITLALNVSIRASSHHCTMPVSRTLRGWIGMEMPSITGPKMTRRTPPVTVESIRVASILCYCVTVTLQPLISKWTKVGTRSNRCGLIEGLFIQKNHHTPPKKNPQKIPKIQEFF